MAIFVGALRAAVAALALGLILSGGCSGGESAQPDAGARSEDAAAAPPDTETGSEQPAHDAEAPDEMLDAGTLPEPDAGSELDAGDATGDAALEAGPARALLSDLIEAGQVQVSQTPRPAYGALVAAHAGTRSYVVEARRDVEPGPLGIPWRSRFRLAAYDGADEAWAFMAEPDDVIGDVVVHPSGEVTLSIEHFAPARDAFELVRLRASGEVQARLPLPPPTSIPAADYGASDPRPLFRMKSPFADATVAGWVRLIGEGEGLAVAFMSFVDVPAQDPRAMRRALGLMRLAWQSNAYVERWARVVEGGHGAEPAACCERGGAAAVRAGGARGEAGCGRLAGARAVRGRQAHLSRRERLRGLRRLPRDLQRGR